MGHNLKKLSLSILIGFTALTNVYAAKRTSVVVDQPGLINWTTYNSGTNTTPVTAPPVTAPPVTATLTTPVTAPPVTATTLTEAASATTTLTATERASLEAFATSLEVGSGTSLLYKKALALADNPTSPEYIAAWNAYAKAINGEAVATTTANTTPITVTFETQLAADPRIHTIEAEITSATDTLTTLEKERIANAPANERDSLKREYMTERWREAYVAWDLAHNTYGYGSAEAMAAGAYYQAKFNLKQLYSSEAWCRFNYCSK